MEYNNGCFMFSNCVLLNNLSLELRNLGLKKDTSKTLSYIFLKNKYFGNASGEQVILPAESHQEPFIIKVLLPVVVEMHTGHCIIEGSC